MPMGYTITQDPGIGYCLECGDIIEYGHGRTDRKFCSDGCKNRWQNIAPINKRKLLGLLDKKIAEL